MPLLACQYRQHKTAAFERRGALPAPKPSFNCAEAQTNQKPSSKPRRACSMSGGIEIAAGADPITIAIGRVAVTGPITIAVGRVAVAGPIRIRRHRCSDRLDRVGGDGLVRSTKWDSGSSCNSSNLELPMSALGHKRTSLSRTGMSAKCRKRTSAALYVEKAA
jgi:hypothetical protein